MTDAPTESDCQGQETWKKVYTNIDPSLEWETLSKHDKTESIEKNINRESDPNTILNFSIICKMSETIER